MKLKCIEILQEKFNREISEGEIESLLQQLQQSDDE